MLRLGIISPQEGPLFQPQNGGCLHGVCGPFSPFLMVIGLQQLGDDVEGGTRAPMGLPTTPFVEKKTEPMALPFFVNRK
jgi:hypothetical protein